MVRNGKDVALDNAKRVNREGRDGGEDADGVEEEASEVFLNEAAEFRCV